MITLYNTLTKTKEELKPRKGRKIQMFVCGPTVYDYVHIGNARTFVFFDVVTKYLRSQEYEVDYIQNITDIDDKTINKAKQENKSWKEVADFYFEEFKKDMTALGVTTPRYIRATDRINEVKKQAKTLVSKNHVYLIENDGWYFDLKTFPEYGKLSGRTAGMAESDDAVSRIDESEKKRNKGDFCVWKLADKSEVSFWEDKELGYGRPGWHIEDTAITESEFGPQYDIHGSGQDLIFPHHEAEITQQESISGLKPFVKYWMHVTFLVNKDAKMSKSLGNFETVNELLKEYPKEVLRFYLLSGHYKKPLDFGEKNITQAMAGSQRLGEFLLKLSHADGKTNSELENLVTKTCKLFTDAMNDDFNTPEAFAVIFEMIKKVNPFLAVNNFSKQQAKNLLGLLKEFNEVLGIIPSEQSKLPTEVQKLVSRREKFREEKNYDESDKIRLEIKKLGFHIEDTVYGPLTSRK